MPEGDTIFRTAAILSRALAGKRVRRFRSPLPSLRAARLDGRTITAVDAVGKNLFVRFDDGRSLHTHMRMHGSWHIYRPRERWQKPEPFARAVIETDDFVAVCFSAPIVELLNAPEERRHPLLSRLGPDILGDSFLAADAVARLRTEPEAELGEALLRQDLLAGIGNIYKSETLFVCRRNPFARVGSLSDTDLAEVVSRAKKLMERNAGPGPRTTRTALGGSRYWVYRRSGKPCHRCGTVVAMRRQGEAGRSTYYCARCQEIPR